MIDRFYTYEGPNEARKNVRLHIDLKIVVAVHELPDREVYLEGESACWTLRLSPDETAALAERRRKVRE